ncbi:hypothetical protein ACOME3_001664 [Neoechinorhynchus agilis]
MKVSLLTICLIVEQVCSLSSQGCIWYGYCGDNRNCVYDGPPILINDLIAAKQLLAECPQFPRELNQTVAACCDVPQVAILRRNLLTLQALTGRCPACYRSLRTVICGISCDPFQVSYMKVDRTVPAFVDPEKRAVREISMVVSESYLQGVIDSCKDVQGILGSALTAICMSSNCTPQALIRSLTSETLGAPAKYNTIVTEHTTTVDGIELRPYTETTFNCSQSVSNEFETFESCSCADCHTSCPIYSFNNPEETKVGSVSVIVFIMIMLGILAVLMAFGLVLNKVVQYLRFQRKLKKDPGLVYFNQQYESAAVKVQSVLEKVFTSIGYFCATRKKFVIPTSLAICAILCAGLVYFKATSDPIALWGVIGGRCIREKNYFDETFSPFYRIAQVYLRPWNQSKVLINKKIYGPIYRQELQLEVLQIQEQIKSITAIDEDDSLIKLSDVCFAPLSPDNNNCTIQSVAQYFGNDESQIQASNWLQKLTGCINSPYDFDCLSDYESPILPYVALGGYDEKEYDQASVMVLTFLNNNYLSGPQLRRSKLWELEFLKFMSDFSSNNFEVSYITERSVEDEVGRASEADLSTILLSYIVMFVYLSIFLGTFRSLRTLFVDTRLILGIAALVMIVVSVLSSFGFYSYLGFHTSIIVLEVTPFLLLAVSSGDNFILVNNYIRRFESQSQMSVEMKVAANLGEIGPSLLLSSCSQALAFAVGAVIPVGAIRVFALYSFLAVVIKFVLQITLFVSVFTLDCLRQEQGRFDLLCCLKTKLTKERRENGFSYIVFERYISPIILNPIAKIVIVLVFVGWFVTCLTLIPRVGVGLDQKITFPTGSHVIGYLNSYEKYARVGAPVYLVVQDGYDYINRTSQNYACSSAGCDPNSISNRAIMLASFPSRTTIEYPPASWIDDYFSWIANEKCCSVNSVTNQLCDAGDSNEKNCVSCPTDSTSGNMRPKPDDFMMYLKHFLNRNPNVDCVRAGHAMHGSAVQLIPSQAKKSNESRIGATNFMLYSTVLVNSSDYVKALEFTRLLSDDMSNDLIQRGFIPDTMKNNNINPVFLYSYFYPFYEQYISMATTTMLNIIYSIIGVFIITFIMLGMDFHSSVIVLLTLVMTMIDLFGIMYLSGVDLNAISVVNLVMAVGIAVEFYAHIVRDYALTHIEDTRERATRVLANIGSSIFVGVTVPELISVATLSTAKSKIFQVFFFRMYLSLILMCTLKALIFLPVILTYLGPKAIVIKQRKSESGISMQSRDQENTYIM